MSNYPPLRLAVLSGLVALNERIKSDPEFLDSQECPYDAETVATLKKLLEPVTITKIVEKEIEVPAKVGRGRPTKDIQLSSEDQGLVLSGIKTTLDELNTMAEQTNLPTSERISIAKTKTSLLNELLKMMERYTTTTKMQAFIETTIGLMDDLMSEDDRHVFMKRLEPFR